MDLKQAQEFVVKCLVALTTGDNIQAAQAALENASKEIGYGAALACCIAFCSDRRRHRVNFSAFSGVIMATVLANNNLDKGLRQLGGVLLRQHVERRWSKDNASFEGGKELGTQEKEAIRQIVPTVLADPTSKLRTAASMVRLFLRVIRSRSRQVIAAIGATDFPDDWPVRARLKLEQSSHSRVVI
jgi:hypothetical protein